MPSWALFALQIEHVNKFSLMHGGYMIDGIYYLLYLIARAEDISCR